MDKWVFPLLAAGALSLASLGLLQFFHAPEWVVWSARVAAVGLGVIAMHQSQKA